LGGYTTYSSFNTETISLAQSGRFLAALVYTASTLGLGLLAGVAGFVAGRAFSI
jgi:CrcB protein